MIEVGRWSKIQKQVWCKYNVDVSNGGVMFVYARLVERHLALTVIVVPWC